MRGVPSLGRRRSSRMVTGSRTDATGRFWLRLPHSGPRRAERRPVPEVVGGADAQSTRFRKILQSAAGNLEEMSRPSPWRPSHTPREGAATPGTRFSARPSVPVAHPPSSSYPLSLGPSRDSGFSLLSRPLHLSAACCQGLSVSWTRSLLLPRHLGQAAVWHGRGLARSLSFSFR